jgi:hypothetical protein
MGGKTFLFDAGDGVQRQLMMSSVNLGEIEKIFSKSICRFCTVIHFPSHKDSSYPSSWRSRFWTSRPSPFSSSNSFSTAIRRQDYTDIRSRWIA